MLTNINEGCNRTPTAPCRCDKPEPGMVLEDKDGKVLETLCARCHGVIRLQDESAHETQAQHWSSWCQIPYGAIIQSGWVWVPWGAICSGWGWGMPRNTSCHEAHGNTSSERKT
jgi:hypothetical protein